MSDGIKVVNKEDFEGKYWRRNKNFLFAKEFSSCHLSIREISKVVMQYSIGFIRTDRGLDCIAILGLHDNKNLYVNQSGKWSVDYVPAEIRSFPFSLAKHPETGDYYVCFDTNSGLLTEDSEDLQFFDDGEGDNSEFLEITRFLDVLRQEIELTAAAAKSLDQHELVKPWEIEIKTEQGIHRVEGLYSIDAEKLDQLSPEQLAKLNESKGLFLAYAQILSMTHMRTLAKVATSPVVTPEGLDIFSEDESLSFDNF